MPNRLADAAARAAALSRYRLAVGAVVVALAVGCTGQPPPTRSGGEPSVGVRIPVPQPFRVAAGEGFVWVLSRTSSPCSPREPCTVSRIDPGTNRPVGTPTPLPADAWDLAVGAGSVWATQFDGRLVRIDARTGRISARISARPTYFGSVVAFGGGFVWTGNDDERNPSGSVSKVDPASNRVVGNVPGLGSPQSIAFGHGAVWVADHAGWLVKIDPDRLEVTARRRLDFGAHGVVAAPHAVYVADAHGGRLLQADPRTARIERVADLDPGPIDPVVGAGAVWSSSSGAWGGRTTDDRVVRVDPRTLRIVRTLHLGGTVPSVAFGFGSVWAPVTTRSVVVRISPAAHDGPTGLIADDSARLGRSLIGSRLRADTAPNRAVAACHRLSRPPPGTANKVRSATAPSVTWNRELAARLRAVGGLLPAATAAADEHSLQGAEYTLRRDPVADQLGNVQEVVGENLTASKLRVLRAHDRAAEPTLQEASGLAALTTAERGLTVRAGVRDAGQPAKHERRGRRGRWRLPAEVTAVESSLDVVTVEVEDVDKVPYFEGSFELGRVAVAAARRRLACRHVEPQALAGRHGDAARIVALASFCLAVVDLALQVLGNC